ncbi:hypothetical protein TNCV_1476721 [Trichonephila clavipes]|nr:hypothetical protein TNCV_1476721 [Trichonephila clavipes]
MGFHGNTFSSSRVSIKPPSSSWGSKRRKSLETTELMYIPVDSEVKKNHIFHDSDPITSTIPVPLYPAEGMFFSSNDDKNISRCNMLRQSMLLLWDECMMSHTKAIEALNRTLQDLGDSTDIMGGIGVLLAGYFPQTIPVLQGQGYTGR